MQGLLDLLRGSSLKEATEWEREKSPLHKKTSDVFYVLVISVHVYSKFDEPSFLNFIGQL